MAANPIAQSGGPRHIASLPYYVYSPINGNGNGSGIRAYTTFSGVTLVGNIE